jgi:hypothetical protein
LHVNDAVKAQIDVAAYLVHRSWLGTRPRAAVAAPDAVTLVGWDGTNDRVSTRTDPHLTSVSLSTGIGVIASRAVRQGGVGAGSGGRCAGPHGVALVGGSAHNRVHARAGSRRASVALGAKIAIIAGDAVGLRGVAASTTR